MAGTVIIRSLSSETDSLAYAKLHAKLVGTHHRQHLSVYYQQTITPLVTVIFTSICQTTLKAAQATGPGKLAAFGGHDDNVAPRL
jgi:hypothetical protein